VEIVLNFIAEFLRTPGVILGLVAGVGLIALRKSPSEVITGVLKTMFGFLILLGGASVIITALTPFGIMFASAFGLTGIIAEDNALVAAVQTVLGRETALIMAFAFVVNVLIARFTPWKYIFLTGHMIFSFAGTMAIVLDQMGMRSWSIILIGSLIQGISMVAFPAISQPLVRRVTGNDEIAFGFFGSLWISLSGLVGGLVGSKESSSEEVKVPDSVGFLRDMAVLMALVLFPIFLATAIVAGPEQVAQASSGLPALQFPPNVVLFGFIQTLIFVAGILILLQGVRMFLAEIVPAFRGVAERVVPGAKPALDVPVFYSYAPVGVTIGFVSAMVGGVLVTLISAWLPVVVLPSVIGLFFMGGAAGVFGNTFGGRRGAIVAGFFLGFTWSLLVALAYPLVDVTEYGVQGLWFATPDSIIVIILIKAVGALFGV
jgi:PTS system ascorbate-specific IIC component